MLCVSNKVWRITRNEDLNLYNKKHSMKKHSMKKKNYLFTLACCSTLFACSPKQENVKSDNANLISINLENPKPLKASEFFDTIMCVPLETSDTYMFSRVSHLKVSDEKDFLLYI